jgi:hypothetical protein
MPNHVWADVIYQLDVCHTMNVYRQKLFELTLISVLCFIIAYSSLATAALNPGVTFQKHLHRTAFVLCNKNQALIFLQV